MQVAVIGAGYVGLVTGVCLAEVGHRVYMIDISIDKIEKLKAGKLTAYEPQLQSLLVRQLQEDRLTAHHELAEGLQQAEVIFLALPTPPQEDGSSDLRHVLKVAESLAPHLSKYTLVVNKSTVPVGTSVKVRDVLAARTKVAFDVVSNPEFLREGKAVQDFLNPQRIVIGTSSAQARTHMKSLYAPFIASGCPLLFMDEASAELSKYAANAFLATKISFINEMAHLSTALGADIRQIQRVLSLDTRIGKKYLHAGIGYGGSCLPKDVSALRSSAQSKGVHSLLLRATQEINDRQRLLPWTKAKQYFKHDLKNKVFAIWGLSFKPETDDLRESPALMNIAAMQAQKDILIRVYDPVAMENAKKMLPNVYYAQNHYDALQGADALFLMTEWPIFISADLARMKAAMRQAVVFDGRNVYDSKAMRQAGIAYYPIGYHE